MSVDLSKLIELKNAMNNRGFANSERPKSNSGNKPKASSGYNANKGSKPNKQNSATGRGSYNNATNPTAPYNFIELNDKIVQPPMAADIGDVINVAEIASKYSKYINASNRYTGYFDVNVENLTPLYIAGEDGFFTIGKNICIPGSSLRGCLKNVFKIITNSAFRSDKENPDVFDKHLYFRSFASADEDFKQLYIDRMIQDVDGISQNVAKAGFIVCKDREYYICPAELTIENGIRTTLEEGKNGKIKLFVGINPNFSDDSCVKWHNNYADVFSGKINSKRSFYRFSNVQWETRLPITKDIADEFLDDTTRKKVMVIPRNDMEKQKFLRVGLAINPQIQKGKTIKQEVKSCYGEDNIISCVYTGQIENKDYIVPENLLEDKKKIIKNKYAVDALDQEISYPEFLCGAEDYNYVMPCFYVAENGFVKHFGFNRYYRIPYLKSIASHIPSTINCNIIDFSDAVFGRKDEWGSRVFFEDLYLDKKSAGNMEHPPKYRKILANPNPTSFQFYLKQDGNNATNWGGNTKIRGYKMYWHKETDWQETKYKNYNMIGKIAPLLKGNTFVGRIRFENLDKVELGALCALFSLGKEPGICYKLGMGKSIGMGTIKLDGTLYLQKKDYYSTLFDDNGFAKCIKEEDIKSFTETFNTYMQDHLSDASLELWRKRMLELRLIMSTSHKQKTTWNAETRYMDINSREDKEILNKRVPLPTISEVVKIKK